MKKLIVVLSLVSFGGILHAQPSAKLAKRINESAALFTDSPGGFDTLFSQDFLNQVPAAQLGATYSDFFQKYGSVTRWTYLDSSKAWGAKVRLFLSKGFTI